MPTVNIAADNEFVREVDLDNPTRKEFENLARFINRSDWKSGTRFRVHGTNKKICGPIHVTNRSLSIEFVDAAPPQITFEVTKGESRELPAFISVTGGTLEIINANFRVGSTAKHLPHWLLEVKNGNFSIRDSSLDGPSFERTGYQGLLHFTSSHSTTARPDQPLFGAIVNSFLRTGKTMLSGELAERNVFIENSILAAGGRVLDLQIPATTGPLSTLDLARCTLAAGEEICTSTRTPLPSRRVVRPVASASLPRTPCLGPRCRRRTNRLTSRFSLPAYRQTRLPEPSTGGNTPVLTVTSLTCRSPTRLAVAGMIRWQAGSRSPVRNTSCGRRPPECRVIAARPSSGEESRAWRLSSEVRGGGSHLVRHG